MKSAVLAVSLALPSAPRLGPGASAPSLAAPAPGAALPARFEDLRPPREQLDILLVQAQGRLEAALDDRRFAARLRRFLEPRRKLVFGGWDGKDPVRLLRKGIDRDVAFMDADEERRDPDALGWAAGPAVRLSPRHLAPNPALIPPVLLHELVHRELILGETSAVESEALYHLRYHRRPGSLLAAGVPASPGPRRVWDPRTRQELIAHRWARGRLVEYVNDRWGEDAMDREDDRDALDRYHRKLGMAPPPGPYRPVKLLNGLLGWLEREGALPRD